jgi:hypothetical protein
VGGIISLRWAASFRYGGRHHPVIVGDIDRNQQPLKAFHSAAHGQCFVLHRDLLFRHDVYSPP